MIPAWKLIVIVAISACAADPSVMTRTIASGDSLDLTWTAIGSADYESELGFASERREVECGEVVSHPCPWIMFTTRLLVDGDALMFGSATGGSDVNGVPAANRDPDVEALSLDGLDGLELTFKQRGDDGGLRHAWRLLPTDDGYAGDVDYFLFTVAGWTRFRVTATFEVKS